MKEPLTKAEWNRVRILLCLCVAMGVPFYFTGWRLWIAALCHLAFIALYVRTVASCSASAFIEVGVLFIMLSFVVPMVVFAWFA